MGCELRAQLAGYRSSAIQLAQRRSMDDPDVGVIFLHRMGKDEGSTVSMTSMLAPKDAKKAFEKGLDALKKKKTEDAQKDFQKAVDAYPKYADAWYQLGVLQLDQKNTEAARTSFGQAIAADPKLVTPYVELAILDAREAKWKEIAESTGKAIRLDPVDFPVAFYFDAVRQLQSAELCEPPKRARVNCKGWIRSTTIPWPTAFSLRCWRKGRIIRAPRSRCATISSSPARPRMPMKFADS